MPSREEDLFLDALALPPTQRAAFLDQACQGDKALRSRLEVLLAAHADPKSLSGAHGLPSFPALPEEKPGDLIGRYKLLEKIGEGGCGTVYMAEQEEPVRRRVALKVIKLGMDTKAVIARFEAERQALAMMDHPNIAKVLDGGATAAGRPYFVMELVRGTPITRYCDENNLPTRERLQLFVQVCQAIQHAHQKGIIHRDIKPSNILVAVHDDVAVPTVIDFGIAKATQGRLTDQTLFTAFEQFIGTPVYMSPEQAGLSSLDVDTRSDVYSLGVLLYELLTGKPPFDTETLRKAGLDEMRRIVREVEPPRPSTRLQTSADAERTAAAKVRGIAPAQLSSLIRGDLDWIAMKALEKNRVRRYETANAFAADIQRYLVHEPVVARPPSTAYRLQKMVFRHRLAFAAGGIVALALVTGAIVSTWQLIRARRAEREQSRLLVVSETARERALTAEESERKLRENAVVEKQRALKQTSRTDFTYATELLDRGRISEGLAYLARAAKSDPSHNATAPRIISALTSRPFSLPVGLSYLHDARAFLLALSRDGSRLVTSTRDANDEPDLHFWDANAGRRVVPPVRLAAAISTHAVDADGTRIAFALYNGTVEIWEVATGRRLVGPLSLGFFPICIAFSPDGRWVASGTQAQGPVGSQVKLWDSRTGELMATLPMLDRGWVSSLNFSPDSTRLVATDFSQLWRVWSVPAGEVLHSGKANDVVAQANSARFSPDGKLVVLSDLAGAQLWDWAAGTKVGLRLVHNGRSDYTEFSRDGTLLITSSGDGTTKAWKVPSGQLVTRFEASDNRGNPRDSTSGGRLSRDGRRLATVDTRSGTVYLFDVDTGKSLIEPLHSSFFTGVQFSPDEREIWTSDRDGVVRRWRTDVTAALPLELNFADRPWVIPQFTESGSLLLRFNDRIEIRDPATGQIQQQSPPWAGRISSVTQSAVGGIAAIITTEGKAELWDYRRPEAIVRKPLASISREILSAITAGFGFTIPFKFSNDGSRLALTDRDMKIWVWETATGRMLGEFSSGEIGIAAMGTTADFDPAGEKLAKGDSAGNMGVFEVATGHRLGELVRQNEQINAVAFSPDGRRVASTGNSRQIRLTDAATGRDSLPPLNLPGAGGLLRFSDDGRFITARDSSTRQLIYWDTQTGTSRSISLGDGSLLYANRAGRFDPTTDRMMLLDPDDRTLRLYSGATGQMLADPIRSATNLSIIYLSPDSQFIAANLQGRPTIKVWPVVPLVTSSDVPGWIPRLATAVVGGVINDASEFQAAPVNPREFASLRSELAALPDDAPYVRWGRWLLADPATRPIHPLSSLSRTQAARLADNDPLGEAKADEVRLRSALNWVEAEALGRDLLVRLRARAGADDEAVSDQLTGLAQSLNGQSRFTEAESFAREALALLQRLAVADPERQVAARLEIGASLAGQRRFAEAEPMLQAAFDAYGNTAGLVPEVMGRVSAATAALLRATNRAAEAAVWDVRANGFIDYGR